MGMCPAGLRSMTASRAAPRTTRPAGPTRAAHPWSSGPRWRRLSTMAATRAASPPTAPAMPHTSGFPAGRHRHPAMGAALDVLESRVPQGVRHGLERLGLVVGRSVHVEGIEEHPGPEVLLRE